MVVSANYVPSKCSPDTQNSLSAVPTEHIYEGTSLNICARFFYYGYPKFSTFDPKGALTILTYYNVPGTNGSRLIKASSNFSVSSDEIGVSTFTSLLGLVSDFGIVTTLGNYVLYSISPTNSTKPGIYFLQLQGFSFPGMIQCQEVMEIAVGNATAYPSAGFSCLAISNTEANGMLANQIVWVSSNNQS